MPEIDCNLIFATSNSSAPTLAPNLNNLTFAPTAEPTEDDSLSHSISTELAIIVGITIGVVGMWSIFVLSKLKKWLNLSGGLCRYALRIKAC